jgi:cell division initiation protein
MALTPVELEGREFSRVRKGYNIDEVDKFFKVMAQEFEALYRENQELKETCNRIRQELGRYKTLESTITETLVTAQKAGEDARNNAVKEAEVIIREAKLQGEEMIARVKADIQQQEAELKANIQQQEAELKGLVKQHQVAAAEMKLFLTTHLELLAKNGPSISGSVEEEPEEEENDEFIVRTSEIYLEV